MLLIIENSVEARNEIHKRLFYDFAINACTSSARSFENAFLKYHITAAYIPNTEAIQNPIGFCRRFKNAHPDIPLIAAVPREGAAIDLDALYRVTDNLPLKPLPMIRLIEIILELERLYTGRDHLSLTCGALTLTPYTFTVLYCGVPLELSVSAVSILRYLCEEAPRPITVQELLKTTCSPERKRTPSAIRTHISEINKLSVEKLGARMVTHIRDRGYIIGTNHQNQ